MKIDKEILKIDAKELLDETMKILYYYEEFFTIEEYSLISDDEDENKFNEFKSSQIKIANSLALAIQLSQIKECSTEKIEWMDDRTIVLSKA